jgi:hypothetical protein
MAFKVMVNENITEQKSGVGMNFYCGAVYCPDSNVVL